MECITTINYSVQLNNELLPPFKPLRGLQQGGPLSPYLFLFVADGLSRILQQQIRSKALHELKICRRAPSISHLLFADNTLLFLEANEQQAVVVHEALRLYERCMGQLINPSKCSIMPGNGCEQENQERVKSILQVDNVEVSWAVDPRGEDD
jgi:hypothetical protein